MSNTKKRSNESTDGNRKEKIVNKDVKIEEEDFDTDDLVFEDPFGDKFEEEIIDEGRDVDDEDDEEEEERLNEESLRQQQEEYDNGGPKDAGPPKQVWRPGVDQLEDGEALEYDPSAYVMYHSMRTEWPCLSFDLMKDSLGDNRQRFPLTMFMITGSQADRAEKNKLTLVKLTELHKTQTPNEEDDESVEEDETLDEDPTIEHVNINHFGGVNRIRSMPQNPGVVLTMADTGHSHVYDLVNLYKSMQGKGPRASAPSNPAYTFKGHRSEGFAVDWSKAFAGRAATGDCAGNIHIWNSASSENASTWNVDPVAYTGHQGSVEDIQWSPAEGTVFASCSSDKTVKIWDTRGRAGPQISFQAHSDDVNVISWNSTVGYLLASGSDDGSFKVWDMRAIRKSAAPLANFTYHKGPITSIQWAPHDESVITVSSADNQVTVWDLSVEADDAEPNAAMSAAEQGLADFPPQLLFIHQGQMNVKEIHHHPQIPGVIVSTAEDGFNVFKPAITVSS